MNAVPVRLDVSPGALYRCSMSWTGGQRRLYRVLGLATDYPSEQQKVVYQGVDGPDAGRLFTCTLNDLAIKFAPEPVPAEAAPARAIDLTEKGSGV